MPTDAQLSVHVRCRCGWEHDLTDVYEHDGCTAVIDLNADTAYRLHLERDHAD
jgi:hypothetical protein